MGKSYEEAGQEEHSNCNFLLTFLVISGLSQKLKSFFLFFSFVLFYFFPFFLSINLAAECKVERVWSRLRM